LAVQSASASVLAADRQALDAEGAQLMAEVQRVASQTRMNGSTLLDGSFANRLFQIGAGRADTISATIAAQGVVGATYTYAGSAEPTGAITAGAVTFDVGSGPVAIQPSGGAGITLADQIAAAVNASGVSGVTAQARNALIFRPLSGPGIVAGINDGLMGVPNPQFGDTSSYALTVNGFSLTPGLGFGRYGLSLAGLGDLINNDFRVGVTASINADGNLVLDSPGSITIQEDSFYQDALDGSGKAYYVSGSALLVSQWAAVAPAGPVADGDLRSGSVTATLAGHVVDITSSHPIVFGGTDPDPAGLLGVSAAPTVGSSFNLTTRQDALDTIAAIDQALARYSDGRAQLGAQQGRMASASANALAASQAARATRSRIADADFATETAEFSRAMILRQTGMALAAQANSEPRLVLSLLRALS
jgi:flagellin